MRYMLQGMRSGFVKEGKFCAGTVTRDTRDTFATSYTTDTIHFTGGPSYSTQGPSHPGVSDNGGREVIGHQRSYSCFMAFFLVRYVGPLVHVCTNDDKYQHRPHRDKVE